MLIGGSSAAFFTRRRNVVLLATLCCLLWGSAYPAIKSGYALLAIGRDDTASQLVFAGWRFVLAGVLLLGMARALGRPVAYNPAALETDCADPADYNCDGSATFDDADSDGFAACEDCDDGDAAVYPGAYETPADGVDGDCDGVDVCWVDADDDGYRPDIDTSVEGGSVACDGPFEASELDPSGDCDDTNASANPAAVEAAGDGVDANCDGAKTCFVDADGDAAPSADGATVASVDTDCADFGEALAGAADCDDTDAAYHPGAPEGDCADPTTTTDGSSGFVDADADGFAACEECDDTDATVSPAAREI